MSDFKGIVLKHTPLNDYDAMLNVLTAEGKVSIKAKGIQKMSSKNRNDTQAGCYSYFHTIERMNQQVILLKNTECVERFNNISGDLVRQSILSCFLEICLKSDFAFAEAVECIRLLDKCENPYCLYGWILCRCFLISGIELVVDECVQCGSVKHLCGFSAVDGGFICTNCYDMNLHTRLEAEKLKSLRYARHAKLDNYSQLEAASVFDFELTDLLVGFLHHYGEYTLRSHAFLKSIQPLV